ncbi:MAG TPA: hypothetical protein VMV10_15700 [Pirellulales bacterium]|nr:hypothetical protein [Pirellulales bacterium]
MSATYSLVSSVLHDHGIKPAKADSKAEEAPAERPDEAGGESK